MWAFIAKNPKQLDICLKLLYSENVSFKVGILDTGKKIMYRVTADTDDENFIKSLEEKYRIMIS